MKPRFSLRWLLAGGTVVALAVAALVFNSGRAQDKAATKDAGRAPATEARPALTVSVVQPQRAQWAQTIVANGSIAAWQEAIVGSETNGGRLVEVNVGVGDRVRRGQVLARFAAEMAQADLAQARAAVAEAEATLAEARVNAQRARDLQASGALSEQQINQMTTMASTAQARLAAARASEQVQQVRLRQTQVLAPDDGVISARTATVGAVVPAGQELFRLIRQGRLEWRAEVAASDVERVKVGQPVTVTPQGGTPVAGTVRMVAPTVDAATRNGLVYVDLKAGGSAKAGMFARGEFEIGQTAAQSLPQTAVLLRDGFSYVFVVEPDNRVRQLKVTVGRRQAGAIEVTGGLPGNARVVAQGAGFLTDGDTVRVVDALPMPDKRAAAEVPLPGRAAVAPVKN